MTADGRVRTGREYLRVSRDKSGRERSVTEQHDENVRACGALGVRLGKAYQETGAVSASRYGRKTRDGFAALVADLEGGRFGADVLVLWEPSRGSRKVSEWVRLVEACEVAGASVYVTSHAREYDPARPRDRRTLLEDAIDSEYESGKASTRLRRARAADAAAGRPHGGVPYGYVRRYDERTRQLVEQTPHPIEAPVVRELFDRLNRGHSLRAIAADFETRDVRTTSGRAWTQEHLRCVALRHAYAGLRVHHGQTYPATWPALVDEATFWAVRRRLCAPERVTTVRPGRAAHLLTQIGRCDPCGGPLRTIRRDGVLYYGCKDRGCVSVAYGELDRFVEALVLAYLARPDVYEALRAPSDDAKAAGVRGELVRARAELDELRAGVAAGRLSVANLLAVEPGLLKRVSDLEERQRQLTTPAALAALITPGRDVRRRWKAAPISTRREVVRLLLAPDLLGELRIARSPGHGPGTRVPAERRVILRTA